MTWDMTDIDFHVGLGTQETQPFQKVAHGLTHREHLITRGLGTCVIGQCFDTQGHTVAWKEFGSNVQQSNLSKCF